MYWNSYTVYTLQGTRFGKSIGEFAGRHSYLWGLREGLILCCNLNIESLVVDLDAQAVVDVMKNNAYVNNIVSPILDYCSHLVARFQQIQLKYCYCQALCGFAC